MKETKCNSCKTNKLTKQQIGIVFLSFYLLFSSAYGTIHLFREVMKLF